MPTEEFLQGVRGGGGRAISTNASGTIETNNYTAGDGFDFDGSAYPYTIDPSEVIEFVHLTDVGDVYLTVTTIDGTTIGPYPLAGGVGVIDWWSADSITFTDPDGTGASLGGAWGGE